MEHDSWVADGVHVSLVEVARFLDGNVRRVRDSDITVASVNSVKRFRLGENLQSALGEDYPEFNVLISNIFNWPLHKWGFEDIVLPTSNSLLKMPPKVVIPSNSESIVPSTHQRESRFERKRDVVTLPSSSVWYTSEVPG